MAKGDDVYGSSDTGNWNVASRFAEVKIMLPLEKCDFYEDVAKFGYHSYLDELMNYNIPTDVLRLSALNRLVNELVKIAKNSMFAMKRSGTKKEMENIVERLNKIKEFLSSLSDTKTDQIRKTSAIEVKEKEFQETLNIVLEIKSDINFPLNKNHLIFTDKEEFDPAAAKKQIKERIATVG